MTTLHGNHDNIPVGAHEKLCHDTCIGGCWGPGPSNCFQCTRLSFEGQCVSSCNDPAVSNTLSYTFSYTFSNTFSNTLRSTLIYNFTKTLGQNGSSNFCFQLFLNSLNESLILLSSSISRPTCTPHFFNPTLNSLTPGYWTCSLRRWKHV